MINSVSAVSFKGAASEMSAQERINAPGKYTRTNSSGSKTEGAPKKKHGFLKNLARLVVAGAVVGGALLLGFRKNVLNVLDDAALSDAKFMQKVGHYLGKFGKYIDEKVWSRLPFVNKNAVA